MRPKKSAPERHTRKEIREIRDEVMKSLHDPDSCLRRELRDRIDWIAEADIEKALSWKVTQKHNDANRKIDHICSYLPRNMARWTAPAGSKRSQSFKELRPTSAVGYAVAAHLRSQTDPIVRACREHYWGKLTPPFPWQDENGSSQYKEILRHVHTWLEEQSAKGSKQFDLTLTTLVATPQEAQSTLNTLFDKMLKDSSWDDAGRPISDLLRALADCFEGLDMTVPDSTRIVFNQKVDFKWSGAVLELTGQNLKAVHVHEGGTLQPLWTATRAIAQLSRWWNEKQALELLLTDHPPQPLAPQLNNGPLPSSGADNPLKKRRKRRELSYTHLALVQLAYVYPDEKPPQWLSRWDQWCQIDRNSKNLNPFIGKKGKAPYTPSGRLTQFRREMARAMKRALQFQPLG